MPKLGKTIKTGVNNNDNNNNNDNDMKDTINTNRAPIIFYDKLLEITQNKLINQRLFLESKINKIKETDSWNKLINLTEFSVSKNELRQDSKLIHLYPNLPLFSNDELNKINMKNIYESYEYLTHLTINAYLLNQQFHKTMKNNILINDKSCQYTPGPIKALERSQAKSETDCMFNYII